MDQTLFLEIGVILVAVAAGVIAVAGGRSRSPVEKRPMTNGASSFSPPLVSAPRMKSEPAPSAVVPDTHPEAPSTGVKVTMTQRVVDVSPEEGGITRRRFLNRATSAFFVTFAAVLGTSMLAFFWPRLSGGFGAKIDAGPLADLKAKMVTPDGRPSFVVIPDARAYLVPITKEELARSQFDQRGLEADGVMAMWWRCVHLGCRTPWCASSLGFECPCHGSRYSLVGEYAAGPAPRNLDRFAIELTDDGRLIIDTATIVQTPRAPTQSVQYPQGPTCI